MKKAFLCLLAVFCLFPALFACRREKETPDLTLALSRVENALGGENGFIVADDDFTTTNFGATDGPTESRILLDAQGGAREVGLFMLADRAAAGAFIKTVRAYLEREQEALSSLAALYPAGELEARLARYKNAAVGSEGALVYYFVLSEEETQKALDALRAAS